MVMNLRLAILALAVCAGSALAETPAKPATRIEIAVTTSGFDPGDVSVPAKKPVTLVFTRKTDRTCAKSIVLTVEARSSSASCRSTSRSSSRLRSRKRAS
jgi:plastocyanin domain-containing protein